MASRHQNREEAIKLLYNVEFMNVTLEDASKSVFEEGHENEEALSYAAHVLNDLLNIDNIIESNLENYSLRRLNAVDRAIIRLATYELIAGEPKAVTINEALELTKEYSDIGDKKAVRFNNRLLDKIALYLNK